MASDSRSPAVPAGGPPRVRARGVSRRAPGPGSGAESPSSWETGCGRKGGRPLARHATHVRGEPGAKPFVDDLLLGRGFVRSRAAPSLRSIESQPSTQGFVSRSVARPRARARGGAGALLRPSVLPSPPPGGGGEGRRAPPKLSPTGGRPPGWGRGPAVPRALSRPGRRPSPLFFFGGGGNGARSRRPFFLAAVSYLLPASPGSRPRAGTGVWGGGGAARRRRVREEGRTAAPRPRGWPRCRASEVRPERVAALPSALLEWGGRPVVPSRTGRYFSSQGGGRPVVPTRVVLCGDWPLMICSF